MIPNACTASPASVGITFKPSLARSSGSKALCLPNLAKFLQVRSLHGTNPGRRVLYSGGIPSLKLSASSASLLKGDHDLSSFVPSLPRIYDGKSSRCLPPRASSDVPYTFRFPAMTKKPRWWWRALSLFPYVMPLCESWMYAETAYNLFHLLETVEYWTYPVLCFIGQLPSWFLMAYFFMAYLGVVRRKEWPHFFRFNVVMGMLLEIALQVVGTVSRWMPHSAYWGKIGMHFWAAFAVGYIFTVLECIRCVLCGMYADVPFVCDAAYIQIPYD